MDGGTCGLAGWLTPAPRGCGEGANGPRCGVGRRPRTTLHESFRTESLKKGSEGVEETRPAIPLIGDEAPDFEAPSTEGPIRLSNYRGQWVVLFSHPADFTPV